MTDELVERLRGIIVQVSAERDRLSGMVYDLTAKVEQLGCELNVAKYGQPDFAWSIHKAAMADLQAECDRLREAAIALRDDMMERAEFRLDTISGEQYRIVNAGNSAWMDFCAALKGETP